MTHKQRSLLIEMVERGSCGFHPSGAPNGESQAIAAALDLIDRKGSPSDPLAMTLANALDDAVDGISCDLHNDGASLVGNTQAGDLEWLARVLFEASRLGAGDVRTVPWLIGPEQWEALGLVPQALMGDGPRRFDHLDGSQKDAWLKLARIVLHVIPAFAERVGHRWMLQAKMAREVWKVVRKGSVEES